MLLTFIGLRKPTWAHAQASMGTLSRFHCKSLFFSTPHVYLSLKNEDISDGRIQDTTGEVIYKVKFSALVFKPYKGKVIDGVVFSVDNSGFMIESGPLKAFISVMVTIPTIIC